MLSGFYTKISFLSTLEALCHHRWAIPVLGELHRTAGSRFVTLTNRLRVSRESLRQTLNALIEGGLVARNPGYGHPLRPEYVLTEGGRRVGGDCGELWDALRRLGVEGVGLKKWSLPTLRALGDSSRRFSELRSRLPGITPRARALALALKDLDAAGLVERRVTEDYPPAALYTVTNRGRALASALAGL